MSQHDMTLADQAGAAFLADVNGAIQALVTSSSGATEPATTYAYQWWADTTTGILKQRNSANSGWIDILKMSTGAPVAAAPRATRIDVASAATLDLTANAPDTDDIRLTGTAAITLVTIAVGRVVRVVASGSSSFANNANIVTNRGATLQLAAGDTLMLRATAANTVEVLGFVAAAPSTVGAIPLVRQTVLSGPVDSNGYSAFGGSVGTATLTAAGTLVATCGAGGNTHRTGSITDPEWTSPGGSGTGYLMLAIDSAGVVATSVRTLLPSYINGTGYSVTNGQFTFSTSENTGKAGNGSTAAQVYEVCVGECPFTSGAWSGTIVWYALMGRYDSGLFAVAVSTAYAKNHNIGVQSNIFTLTLSDDLAGTSERPANSTSGYANTGSGYGAFPTAVSRNSITMTTFNAAVGYAIAGGGAVVATGYYRYKIQRGW